MACIYFAYVARLAMDCGPKSLFNVLRICIRTPRVTSMCIVSSPTEATDDSSSIVYITPAHSSLPDIVTVGSFIGMYIAIIWSI